MENVFINNLEALLKNMFEVKLKRDSRLQHRRSRTIQLSVGNFENMINKSSICSRHDSIMSSNKRRENKWQVTCIELRTEKNCNGKHVK